MCKDPWHTGVFKPQSHGLAQMVSFIHKKNWVRIGNPCWIDMQGSKSASVQRVYVVAMDQPALTAKVTYCEDDISSTKQKNAASP